MKTNCREMSFMETVHQSKQVTWTASAKCTSGKRSYFAGMKAMCCCWTTCLRRMDVTPLKANAKWLWAWLSLTVRRFNRRKAFASMEQIDGRSFVRTDLAVARNTSLEPHPWAHRVFETWASRMPQRVAVRCGDEQLTYAELNTQANQLAWYLQVHGAGRETLVGVCLQRGMQMVVAILAVLKAGAAYVPLDPTYPAERLSFILNDARPKLLITQKDLPVLPSDARRIELDHERPLIAKQSVGEPEVPIGQDNLAYIIYTSGSMGQPKGVMI